MKIKPYNFYAIEQGTGYRIEDRYQLEAYTFAEACMMAQDDEIQQAIGEDREPANYNVFKEII